MDRRTLLIGIVSLTTGCIANRIVGADEITGQTLTKSRKLEYNLGEDNNLPKAIFKPEKHKVMISAVLGVADCNKAIIRQAAYNSETSTLTIKFDEVRRDDVSSGAGCGGTVYPDVYTATIVLKNDATPKRVVVESDGHETTIDNLSG